MKALKLLSLLPVLTVALLFTAPASSLADRKVTVVRDRDGDGHYNKKSYDVSRDHHYPRGSSYRPYGYRPYIVPSPSVTVYSRPVYSGGGEYYSDDLAVDVQRELRRRGYYYGTLDGDVGPGTRAAIRAYQADRRLAPTGRIDRSLLRALGIG